MNTAIKAISLSVCLLVLSTAVCKAGGTQQLTRLKENYRNMLLAYAYKNDALSEDLRRIEPETEVSDNVVADLQQRYPFDLEKMAFYLSVLNEKGMWTDINYQDTKRSGWDPTKHAERILELSKLYYTPATRYYHSDEVKNSIHRALHYWFSAKLQCNNWWYNQIGIPKIMGAAFILLENQLTPEEKLSAIEVMQASRFGMTGQNKVWLAGNVLICALLKNDEQLVKSARDTIASEIALGREEGIKNDWSYHQHGAQLQFGNYGLSFVTSMSFFYSLFQGTVYAFDRQQMNILSSLIDKGYRWTIWNRYMDMNALGRQLFHNAQLHKAYGLALAAAELGIKEGFPKAANTLIGHKHFDNSDYTVHRAAHWMASVRMSSNRVIGTELVNEDNLKGYYLGDGATYYYTKGDEYLNIFPFWDWRKVPGVTAYEDKAPLPDISRTHSGNRTDKVGGLSDGFHGMAAMELNRDSLKAYKAWVFTDDFVICMGAGISTNKFLPVTTSIEQCLKKGDLFLWNKHEWLPVSEAKLHDSDLHFYHNHIGYIVLNADTCVAEAGERTGQWADFMKMYTPAVVTGETVSIHLRHGIQPQHGSYLYIVLPDVERNDVSNFDTKNIRVVQNDDTAQIVYLPRTGCYWVAVYHPGKMVIEGEPFVTNISGIYKLTKSVGKLKIEQKRAF